MEKDKLVKVLTFNAKNNRDKIELSEIKEIEIAQETYDLFKWDGVNILHFEHITCFCCIHKDSLTVFKLGFVQGINFCKNNYQDYLNEVEKCQEKN